MRTEPIESLLRTSPTRSLIVCGICLPRPNSGVKLALRVRGNDELARKVRLMLEWIRFGWKATRGYRLRPWKSPYILWRVETYTGKPAATVRLGDLLRLVWAERSQMFRFMQWLSAMRAFRHPQA